MFAPDISISFFTIMLGWYLEPGVFPHLPTFPDEDESETVGDEALPEEGGKEVEAAEQESNRLPSSDGGLLTRAEEANALKSCDIIQWP